MKGDGYQNPDTSSSGSASAMSSYPWLDFTVGSDSQCLWYYKSSKLLTVLIW